jgi:peptide/nickel transport system permease protein
MPMATRDVTSGTAPTPGLAAAPEAETLASTFAQPQVKHRTLKRLRRHPMLIVSGTIVTLYVLIGVLAPWIAPHSYTDQDLVNGYLPPLSEDHVLGTDHLGRDMASRLFYGIRTSLFVSAVVTGVTLVVGMLVGFISGYYGGWVDRLLSSVIDMFWGFPIILVAIIVVAIIGPGVKAILIGISIVNWAGFARIMRGEVLALRNREFVDAARTVGAGTPRILIRHIFPNVLAITFVMASFLMGIIITAEAGLSFIGLGAQPPLPSLGQMVAEGKSYFFRDLWLITIPGVTLALAVLAFNQLGDSLRDFLDPRLQ